MTSGVRFPSVSATAEVGVSFPALRRAVDRTRPLWSQGLVLVGAITLWELARRFQINSNSLPSTATVVSSLLDLLTTTETWMAIRDTFSGLAVALLISVAVAIPFGIVIGRSAMAYRSTRLLIDFLRTVPGLALIPLASLMFGTRLPTELLIVVPTCVWPLLLQTAYGARDIEVAVLDVARSFRLGRRRTFWRVIVPSCAGYIATGARLAVIMGFIATIGTELVAGTPGVGFVLAQAQALGEDVNVYAYTLLVAFMGFTMATALAWLERRLIPWQQNWGAR